MKSRTVSITVDNFTHTEEHALRKKVFDIYYTQGWVPCRSPGAIFRNKDGTFTIYWNLSKQ